MCKATRICSELGDQPQKWSTSAPLPPPAWFETEIEKFQRAVKYAAAGDVARAVEALRIVRGDDLRTWYVVHGQNSGVFRNRHFGVGKAKVGDDHRGAPPGRLIAATYKRDRFCCRYCGLRLFPTEVLRAFESVVGTASFASAAKNASHGAALVFRATYDHVVPTACGGAHQLENLVTACYSCNFGKGGFTLEQLGLDDPRAKPLSTAVDWDGFVSLIPDMKAVSTRST